MPILPLLLSLLLTPPQAGPATFEVATIRPSNLPADQGRWSPPGKGVFTAQAIPLTILMKLAYGIDESQIANQPPWFKTQLYDVSAKSEPGIPLTRDQLKPRLQALLADRFHLTLHHETRMLPGLILQVAKSGAHLEPTKGDHFPGFRIAVDPGEMIGANWSMTFLAAQLITPTGLPVLDRTGLTGSYDIKLLYAPDPDSPLPSLTTALHESLGLDLKPEKVPVDTLVIDHIDRTPTEN